MEQERNGEARGMRMRRASAMRTPLLALLLLAPALLAGCTGERGTVARDDLAFPVASRLAGVNATAEGDIPVTTTDGVLVTPSADGTAVTVGLHPIVQTNVFQACAEACRGLTLPPGSVVAESALLSLRNVSLNAAGPDGDSGVLFYDNGQEGGRFLRWYDAGSKFQMNGDLQVVGNVTGTGHVGTVTPLQLGNGAVVTVSTAALEGTEAAIFARGSGRLINGNATIALPSAFTALAADGPVTVQVTLRSPGPALWVSEATAERILVHATEGSPSGVTFDWFAQAPRKGGERFEV